MAVAGGTGRTGGAPGGQAAGRIRAGMTTGLMLGMAVAVLALPSAVLAFSNRFDPEASPSGAGLDTIEAASAPAGRDAALAVRSLAHGAPFHFTPAGTPTRPDRSITVAVRVDPLVAREIIVRGNPGRLAAGNAKAPALQLAPSAFNLGVSRGYQSFAQNLVPPVEIRKVDMPDLSAYQPGQSTRSASSRFAPRISFDERTATGRAPRTFSGDGEDRVDVGGALRLTKNLDVTAGVRYSQERDRLKPLTDGKQDSQAVYVGTQFRF